MSAKSKLNEARKIFHARRIKKTGHNDFSNYDFFELADFLMPGLDIFYDLKLSGIVSFGKELATMEITDLEDESSVVLITSPMSTAALKACHEVQNLGAVETYIRRYLWVVALEIVEHEAIDSSPGPEEKPAPAVKDTSPSAVARRLEDGVKNGDIDGVIDHLYNLDDERRNAIWAHLSPVTTKKLTAAWPK